MTGTAILLLALGFAAMAGVALARPEQSLAQCGMPQLTADGRSEVRAVHGGFGPAAAAMLVTGLLHPGLRADICLTLAAALLGLAAGRGVPIAVERALGQPPLACFT